MKSVPVRQIKSGDVLVSGPRYRKPLGTVATVSLSQEEAVLTFTDGAWLSYDIDDDVWRAIRYVPDYDGHWRGAAWITTHPYGEQVHRSRSDAERWLEQRVPLDGAP